MREVEFDPATRLDFLEAFNYYEEQRPGLGDEIALEVEDAVDTILQDPAFHNVIHHDIRRFLLKRFIFYSLLYVFDDERLNILRLIPSSRNPAEWQERL